MAKPTASDLNKAPKRTQIIVRASEMEIQAWKLAARVLHMSEGRDPEQEPSMSRWIRLVLNATVGEGK